jgi:hypothetical protein
MINILLLTISFLALLAMGMFWYKLLRFTPEESIAMAIMCILILTYVFGLIGKMFIAIFIFYAIALLGVALFVFNLPDGKYGTIHRISIKSLSSFFTPGILLLCIAFVYSTIAFFGTYLQNWDEYAQWGKAAKFIISYNALPFGQAGSLFDGQAEIMSSTTFFQYFMCFTTGYKECFLYTSNFVLWFAAILLPMSGTGWRNWKGTMVYGAVAFLAMNVLFVQPYYNIYCDQPVTMWAGALVAWQLRKKDCTAKWILAFMIIVNIPFMKSMVGPLLACICVLGIAICYLLQRKADSLSIDEKPFKLINWKTAILGVFFISAPFILTLIWSHVSNTDALLRNTGSSTALHPDRLKLTLVACLQKLFQPVTLVSGFPSFSYASYFVLSAVISFIASKYLIHDLYYNKYKWMMKLYLVGFVPFFLVMVFAYMYTFGYADSIQAGSLNRYFSDYMLVGLPMLICPFCLGTDSLKTQSNGKYIKWGVLATIVCVLSFSINFGFFDRISVYNRGTNSVYNGIIQVRKYCSRISKITEPVDKVYMISQDDYTFWVVVADYALDKQWDRGADGFYFFDNPNKSGKIAGLPDYSIDDLPDRLLENNYKYVWIYKTDPYLQTNLKRLFNIKKVNNGDFYKVIQTTTGVQLQLVENIKDNVNK